MGGVVGKAQDEPSPKSYAPETKLEAKMAEAMQRRALEGTSMKFTNTNATAGPLRVSFSAGLKVSRQVAAEACPSEVQRASADVRGLDDGGGFRGPGELCLHHPMTPKSADDGARSARLPDNSQISRRWGKVCPATRQLPNQSTMGQGLPGYPTTPKLADDGAKSARLPDDC
ncbi:hypothetical protein ACLOJK_041939 [Asimina triloba]